MVTSDKGKSLIRHYEKFSPVLYYCPAGKPTIGWGVVVDPVKYKNVKLTEADGEKMFELKLKEFEVGLSKLIKTQVNQDQFDGCVSFAYNVGLPAFEKSTLLKLINKNPLDPMIEQEFCKWNIFTSDGKKKISKGLTLRRLSEAHLYETGEVEFYN
jgi:lysozyme